MNKKHSAVDEYPYISWQDVPEDRGPYADYVEPGFAPGSADTETWTFEMLDGSTVEKVVSVWSSTT